uniref:Uncharacterized protein n=1 Tax=Candidatus Kentrum sp. FM TaxID=2126340 RepID=A0A450VVN7_9GAMM|nr:MAG: hypothetical protein BECKFM1743A_GA0114220_100843 [Candidatus Kentron sp. FM]VFJ51169.1 MAG: hypothetical protein BECKFM1743C_GA0114222_100943 [Candidatus Kentron sp. FM]VFK08847.1 MAG: hypothetical protein BECKFM1743B_GA0114221_100833 [Candidatus Kentron sp. FM]
MKVKKAEVSKEDTKLAGKILLYRKAITGSSGNIRKGLLTIFPYIDRHYYINLRTKLDSGTKTGVRRDMWMYFPASHQNEGHAPSWPDPEKLREIYNCKTLENFNYKNGNEQQYGFPYNKSGVTFIAISEYNEAFFDVGSFKEFCVNDVTDKLKLLFGKYGLRPEGYDEFLWGVEKNLIYEDFPDDKIWIYYPLSFRNIFVSVLLARIPKEKLDGMINALPVVSSAICEKLLLRYNDINELSPMLGVADSTSALTLVSAVAAQCQLNDVVCEGKKIRFFSSQNPKNFDRKSYNIQISSNVDYVEFDFPLNGNDWKRRNQYFDLLWKSISNMLRRFSETFVNRLAFSKAALISRNLSHNIGSHALASPKLLQSLDKISDKDPEKAKTTLGIFHQYLQNRLDYIARALNPAPERPEPLFFVNEVLNGFFREYLLLETLLEDQGFTSGGKPIRFHVRARARATTEQEGEKEGIYTLSRGNTGASEGNSNSELPRFKLTHGSEPTDVLIGVMGGMIGAQALYSFLENVMRNAAKYGADRDEHQVFDIHLDLRDAGHCETGDHQHYFVLEIRENLSRDDGNVAEAIRRHLDEDLIDDKGEPVTKGQGIQEMKMAAEFLSGGHVFKSDAESLDYEDGGKTGSHDADSYCGYIKALDDNDKNGPQPLRCYVDRRKVSTNGDTVEANAVVYQLLIPKARLAGVVNTADPTWKTHAGTDAIIGCRSVEELAEAGAAFGVILDSNEADIAEIVIRICEHHNALPFRLIVLTGSPEHTKKWEDDPVIGPMLIGYKTGNEKEDKTRIPFDPDEHLPARRVHIIESERLHGIFGSANEPDALSLGTEKFLGATGWNAALLMLYHHWLIAFKGVPPSSDNTWKLVIGFERPRDRIRPRWEVPLELFDAQMQKGLTDDEVAIAVHLYGRIKKGQGDWENWETPLSSKNADAFTATPLEAPDAAFSEGQSYVVFDNHGKAISGVSDKAIDSGVRCLHEFSGASNIALFQSLESPPQEPFSFAWFIYSLLESALLNVVIIDERVAGAAAESKNKVLRNLNRAGMFPVFSLRKTDPIERFWLNDPSLESKLYTGPERVREKRRNELKLEGMDLSVPTVEFAYQSSGAQRKVCSPNQNADADNPIHPPDAVIIHEGVVDVVLGTSVWEKEGLEQRLLAIAPRIIRTSGRGSQARYLSPALPFMEFSELSETTYRALNKLTLGKAVLGVFGPRQKNGGAT